VVVGAGTPPAIASSADVIAAKIPPSLLAEDRAAIAPPEELDAYFAAGAIAMATALSYRRRKSRRRSAAPA